ncbi:MAG: DUF885 domain-containing protein [Acidimicrobiales bacterium]
MTTTRDFADRFHASWLSAHPFDASARAIPGYDDRVPDDSEAGDKARRSEVQAALAEAERLLEAVTSPDEAVTLGCVAEAARQELAALDSAAIEYTVTAMPFSGPAVLFLIAARTLLPDAKAAGDYLARLRSSGRWIDQLTERLRAGAAKGRLPVASLVAGTISWAEMLLAQPVPEPLKVPQPPEGWDGATSWEQERDALAAEVVSPALGRWLGLLRELLPASRPDELAGLAHLPDGAADYARAIRAHTTLALTAEELHRIGLDEIARLEELCIELATEIGLPDLASVQDALRASAGEQGPQTAIDGALRAIRRAEARASEVFPEPLPPPCAVTPMPSVVAVTGMAPHYSPPRPDGARPGTYWFNTERPTAGSGWDLEVVAFHEAVPGHHLQIARVLLLSGLPAIQRERSLTVFSEGWGLYAEQLAEEMGLYSGTESLIGAVSASLMRAARLVVDTGLHALGWSRSEALEFFTAHVPMPPGFLASEIDRYIAMPGQALAYLTGKREILRLRAQAIGQLGHAFSLPDFHAAVLDQGSLPMPVLERAITDWVSQAGPAGTNQAP